MQLVVVGFNVRKCYNVSPESRAKLLAAACERQGLSNVSVHAVDGYVWRFAMRHGVRRLYRGIRSWEADGAAERWLLLLNQLGPVALALRWPLPTTFLLAGWRYEHVSSTLIRKLCASCADEDAAEGQLAGLVPPGMERDVWRAYTGELRTTHGFARGT